MKSMSSHEGGVAGYIKDRIKGDIDRANNDLYWKMENHLFTNDPEDTSCKEMGYRYGQKYWCKT
jgi:hypothetical protein